MNAKLDIYTLCIALFTNLAILKDPIDKNALYYWWNIMCVLFVIAHFIVRKFYPNGDKFILTFCMYISCYRNSCAI